MKTNSERTLSPYFLFLHPPLDQSQAPSRPTVAAQRPLQRRSLASSALRTRLPDRNK